MKSLSSCLGFVALCLLACSSGFAATISYSDNFNSYATGNTTPTGFTEGVTGSATNTITEISPGNNGYTHSLPGSATSYGSIPMTNAPGLDFIYSINFRMDALVTGSTSSATINHSLVALGDNSNLSSGSSYRLSFVPSYAESTIANTGRLVLAEVGSTGLTGTLTSLNQYFVPAANVGASAPFYTLQLSGTYSGGSLTLVGTLLLGTEVLLTVNGTDATPLVGTNFGVRFASNSALNTGTVTYDNLSIVVPEPAAAGLLMVAALGCLGRRRKR